MCRGAGLAKIDISSITKKWLELQDVPKVFAYRLQVRSKKRLPGNYHFYAEYNPDRSRLRRTPQTIECLNPPFDDKKFHFNKINPLELIALIPFNDIEVSFIINKSPLTKYHTLICPDVEGRHNQRVTLDSLRFCTFFLQQLKDMAFRIGYNSPGALASVNHLHFHLIYLDEDLYIDNVKLELLAKEHIFRFSKDMPTQGICWHIYKNDSHINVEDKLNEIYNFLMWLCCRDRPHNIVMTLLSDRESGNTNGVKIFVLVRKNYCIIKDLESLNIGFCEFAGYVPVGNLDVYSSLTEGKVISKIGDETGDVYNEVYTYFEDMK